MARNLKWYFHRFRAMSLAEVMRHCIKKCRQSNDKKRLPDFSQFKFEAAVVGKLPNPLTAPASLKNVLISDVSRIREGRWLAFGRLPIQVQIPPEWERDYFVQASIRTSENAFRLDHRTLPQKADIKFIWELSRWHEISRLAQAAYVTADLEVALHALSLLEDWIAHNPPWIGWNWTSALESGMRLIQFCWVDELLSAINTPDKTLKSRLHEKLLTLRRAIIPAHCYFTWRYRSFGSSANNHLIGELAGLIVAACAWPQTTSLSVSVAELLKKFETEILKQFLPDGGNVEQALNYHLFSFEFAWLVKRAIARSGLSFSKPVEERLEKAVQFYVSVQSPLEPWDYGDSDNGFVLPIFEDYRCNILEWWNWMNALPSPGLAWWLGNPPGRLSIMQQLRDGTGWASWPESGLLSRRIQGWTARLDISQLGYGSTAAHGHSDALHLSLWKDGVAMVIDPGTGAYYGDSQARNYFSSWEAHNGPIPDGFEIPKRLGPFLWSEHHEKPGLTSLSEHMVCATFKVQNYCMERKVQYLPAENGWRVEDMVKCKGSPSGFMVHWQFPPGAVLKAIGAGTFLLQRAGKSLKIVVTGWDDIQRGNEDFKDWHGLCSPFFRQISTGPYLILRFSGHKACVLHTTFLASGD